MITVLKLLEEGEINGWRLKYYEALDKTHTTCNYTEFVKLVTKLEIEMYKKYLELI